MNFIRSLFLAAFASLAVASHSVAATLDNYSMPASPNPVPLYITNDPGCSDVTTDPTHGSTVSTSFCTFDAALLHAKVYVRFTGRLNTVVFKFEGGIDWGHLVIGSNLEQGEDYFPFTIKITSIDNSNRARFLAIGVNSWHPNYLYVTQVKANYFVSNRRNAMVVNDVDVINTGTGVQYAFRAAYGGRMNVFGTIDFEDTVTYSTAIFYAQDMGYISLENGDTPTIFPEADLTGLGNVTTPNILRMILGSGIYMPVNPYSDLQAVAGGAYYVDSTSYSTQTQTGTDLDKNSAIGGPVVARGGTETSGWEKTADGKIRQWGAIPVTASAVGVSSPASAALTFPTAFGANPRIKYNVNSSAVIVSNPGPGPTGLQFVVNNIGSSPASFTIFWEASGEL